MATYGIPGRLGLPDLHGDSGQYDGKATDRKNSLALRWRQKPSFLPYGLTQELNSNNLTPAGELR